VRVSVRVSDTIVMGVCVDVACEGVCSPVG